METLMYLAKYLIFSIIWIIYWLVHFLSHNDFPNTKKVIWIFLPIIVPAVSYLLFYW